VSGFFLPQIREAVRACTLLRRKEKLGIWRHLVFRSWKLCGLGLLASSPGSGAGASRWLCCCWCTTQALLQYAVVAQLGLGWSGICRLLGCGEGREEEGIGRSGTKARAPCSSTTLHPPCSVFPSAFLQVNKIINNNALAFLARSWCHGLVRKHNILWLRPCLVPDAKYFATL
jgi:hypothetical protein